METITKNKLLKPTGPHGLKAIYKEMWAKITSTEED